MRARGFLLGRIVRSQVPGGSCYFSPHLQHASFLLAFAPGASCSVEDARRLFARCCVSRDYKQPQRLSENTSEQRSLDEDKDTETLLEESMITLERLGLISFSEEDDEMVVERKTKIKKIYRGPVITVKLHSIDVTALHGSESGKEVLFQMLYGVILPLMFSRISTSSSSSASSYSSKKHNRSFVEEISAEQCLGLLQQSGGASSHVSQTTCRFIIDLVNEAMLVGVRERVLFPSGGGLFRLHHDMLQQVSPCLLTFQWWWWRRVDAFLSQSLTPRMAGENISLESRIDAVQSRVQYWIKKRDDSLPRFILHGKLDSSLALVEDAVRCWCTHDTCEKKEEEKEDNEKKKSIVPRWRLQLSEDAKVALALETFKSIKLCLSQHPAGLALSELSKIVSWPLLSSILQKKSLSNALTQFPSHFIVHTVQDVTVAQLQLCASEKTLITPAEVELWVLGNRNELSSTSTSTAAAVSSHPPPHPVFVREVELVIRVVTYLRKRYMHKKRTTFKELRAFLTISNADGFTDNMFVDVLHRYDVLAGIHTNGINISWGSLQKNEVHLSSRERDALKALDAFRKSKENKHILYNEAIKPFLFQCNAEMMAMMGADVSVGSMPILLLDRWLQASWISLKQTELIEILHEYSLPFVVDQKAQCIIFGCPVGNEDVSKISASRSPPVVAKPVSLSSPPPPMPTHVASPTELTFDSQLSRVLTAENPDALVHFANSVMHAAFVMILPHVSAASGIRLKVLHRRIRWGSVIATVGSLSSFLEAFDGLFFDLLPDTSGPTEDMVVMSYRGPLGVWLLYARLISRLFPSNVDIPLRLVAEGLSWSTWFAPRFGDLPTLLRRMGRTCREGYLIAKNDADITPVVVNDDDDDDMMVWRILENVRAFTEKEHGLEKGEAVKFQQQFVSLKPVELSRYLPDAKEIDKKDYEYWMQIAETAVRRFPLFFQWYTAPHDCTPLLRITLKQATASNGLLYLVEGYVCPLLRQCPRCGFSIADLDNRLGWSRGFFDIHPAALGALNVVSSGTSLFGILKRYMEVAHTPRLLLLMQEGGGISKDTVMIRPNTDYYKSPEDMLLEVNGLEYVEVEDGLLRPSGRPLSLFELLAEEQELHDGKGFLTPPLKRGQWHVLLQCEGTTCREWEREFETGNGDIVVWCDN